MPKPLTERFTEKFTVVESGCHEWTAGTFPKGYGAIKVQPPDAPQRKTEYAHRVSWYINTGEWPELNVRHRCDNPPCVRFDHLILGTQLQNMRDKIDRGRAAPPPMQKLTAEQAAEIRELIRRGGQTKRAIAQAYGVSPTTIGDIAKGRTHMRP